MGKISQKDPAQRYELDLQRQGFSRDAAQAQAVAHLQGLYERLCAQELHGSQGARSWFQTLLGMGGASNDVSPVRGLYFWGGVGRGKTYLMDSFYESLPFEKKMRTHFHRFMRRVHGELRGLEGEKNPLEIVAQRLSREAVVICFDEFFVSDITDAMILANLLDGLFRRGVTLVATSNIVPDGLYRDGLQRARFLPAIALLNRHTDVVNVDGGVDYRLRALEQAELYHFPLDDTAESSLQSSFDSLVPDKKEVRAEVILSVEGRAIAAKYEAEDVVWFEFDALCDGPRSQNDYIELAREYHAVLVSNVPQLGGRRDDQARRFLNLVDEFYDRGVKLIVSAEVALPYIYVGGRLSFEYERVVSRLLEMQSHDYLARPHKP